jgi:hypothetical protein
LITKGAKMKKSGRLEEREAEEMFKRVVKKAGKNIKNIKLDNKIRCKIIIQVGK